MKFEEFDGICPLCLKVMKFVKPIQDDPSKLGTHFVCYSDAHHIVVSGRSNGRTLIGTKEEKQNMLVSIAHTPTIYSIYFGDTYSIVRDICLKRKVNDVGEPPELVSDIEKRVKIRNPFWKDIVTYSKPSTTKELGEIIQTFLNNLLFL